MFKLIALCAICLATLPMGGLLAATHHVPGDFETIMAAIDAAENGDSILVAAGEYAENVNFGGKAVSLISAAENGSVSVIDGGENGPCVAFTSGEGEGSRLIGFTLTNGVASGDGYGGGVLIERSSPLIFGNFIYGNRASQGGGGISVSFEGCNPLIERNIIIDNETAGGGGGVSFYQSAGMLVNNTILSNSAQQGGAGVNIPFTDGVRLVNNIVAFNHGGGIAGWQVANATLTFNDVFDNQGQDYSNVEAGEGSISNDPLFADPDNDDYSLNPDSPCIDAGLEDEENLDYDGSPADVGALALHQRDLFLPDTMFTFEPLELGSIDSVLVQLLNIGKTPISIRGIADHFFPEDETCYFVREQPNNDDPLVIEGESGYELWLFFRPEESKPVESKFIIVSDDFDKGLYPFFVSGEISNGIESESVTVTPDLMTAYPNPFNGKIMLSFALPSETQGTLAIYNASGEVVETLTTGKFSPGVHQTLWNADEIPNGIYIVMLLAPDISTTTKIILLR